VHFFGFQKGDSKMRISILSLMLSTVVLGTAAWAQDYQASENVSSEYDSTSVPQSAGETSDQTTTDQNSFQAPGTTDDTSLATTAESSEVTRGYLSNELVGVKPQVGVIAFTDQLGNSQGRAAYGFTLESNIAGMVGLDKSIYMGPQTGFIFSHLGEPSSNLFGADSDTPVGAAGSNMFFIPANLKVGYNVTDRFRVGAHGGGNVVYRSVASAMNLGDSSAQDGSVWRIFPNVGGDVEYAVGPNLAVMARPDVTLTPGDTIFTGTVALNLALG
jgi:hypothetical protein